MQNVYQGWYDMSSFSHIVNEKMYISDNIWEPVAMVGGIRDTVVARWTDNWQL